NESNDIVHARSRLGGFICAPPDRKRICELRPFRDVHGGFPRYEACVQPSAKRTLVHAGADEHDFLAAIAIDVVPVLTQPLPPERIIRPSFRRHARPPRTKGLGARDRTSLTDFTKPMRARRQPEMSFGANDAGPGLLDELVEPGWIEGPARAINEVLH